MVSSLLIKMAISTKIFNKGTTYNLVGAIEKLINRVSLN